MFVGLDSDWRVKHVSHDDFLFLDAPARHLRDSPIWDRLGALLPPHDAHRLRQAMERRSIECFELDGPGPEGGWSVTAYPCDVGLMLHIQPRASAPQAPSDATILNALTAHVAVLDREGRIVRVNDPWLRFAAQNGDPSRSRIGVGANYLDVCRACAPADAPEARVAFSGIQAVLEGAVSSFNQEYPCHAPDRQRWFLMTVTALADGSGAVVTHTDITERKVAEASLRQSEERYRGLIEGTHEGVWVTDPAGATLYVNAPMAAMLGTTPQRMVGRPARAFVFPEDLPAFDRRAADRTHTPGGIQTRERFRREDGVELLARVTSSLIHDAQGRVEYILELVTDVTAAERAQATLDRANQRLSLVLDAMTDVFFSFDRDWRITHLNAHAQRLVGRPREQIVGVVYWDAFPESHDSDFAPHLRRAMEQRVVTHFEARSHLRPGRWFDVHAYPTHEGLSVFAADITDSRQAQVEIRRLALLVQRAADLVAIIEMDHRVSYINPAGRALLGLPPADTARGLQIEDLFLTDDLPDVQSHMLPQVATQGRWVGEYRLLHRPSGEPIDVVWDLFRIDDPQTGRPQNLAAIGRDVRRQKEADRALALARQATEHNLARFEAIAESLTDGLLIADAHGRIVRLNPAFRLIHGVPAADPADPSSLPDSSMEQLARGWELRDLDGRLLPIEDWPLFRALRGERLSNVELRVSRLDTGHAFIGSYSATPARDQAGVILCAVLTCRDVTAHKAAEEALRQLNATLDRRIAQRVAESDRRADQLRVLASELTRAEERERKRLAQILHDDLQQLLVASRLRADLLRARGDETQDEDLRELIQLLGDAIASSRALTAELSPPILHAAGLIPALEWLARWTREKHHIEVDFDARPDAEPQSEDLRVFLFRAARELILNAAKHSGSQRLSLALSRVDERLIELAARDDGRGFDPAAAGAHREPGLQGGFGLFSIRERVAVLDGRLEIDSAPGRGALLRVLVPSPAPAPPPLAQIFPPDPARSHRPIVPGAHDPLRVLIADDHKIVRDGLRALLASDNRIDIIGEASDGQEALDEARRLRPNVVIMDAAMPRMDGVEATRRLLAEMPDVRVLGLSMHQDPEMAAAMRRAGAAAFLSKDAPTDQILRAIRGPESR